MIKLESLKKNIHFKTVLKEKKVHTDFFSIFAAKRAEALDAQASEETGDQS